MTIARRISKGIFYLLVFPATLGVCAWQGWSWWSWATAPPRAGDATAAAAENAGAEKTVQIEIPPGTSAQQIGADLEAAGLIRSRTAWNLWTRWQTLQNREGGFQAGTYALSPDRPLDEIANQVWQGDVVQASFTIPEGWSMRQMAAYFQERGSTLR